MGPWIAHVGILRDSRSHVGPSPRQLARPVAPGVAPVAHVSQSNVTRHSPRQNALPQARTPRRQAIPALLSRDCRLLRAKGGLRRLSNKIAFAEHGDGGVAETRRSLRDSQSLKSDRCRLDRLRLAPPRLPISDSSALSAPRIAAPSGCFAGGYAGLPAQDAQVARPEAGAPLPRNAPHVGKRQDACDGPPMQLMPCSP